MKDFMVGLKHGLVAGLATGILIALVSVVIVKFFYSNLPLAVVIGVTGFVVMLLLPILKKLWRRRQKNKKKQSK